MIKYKMKKKIKKKIERKIESEITPMMYKWLPWLASFAFFMQMLDASILNTAIPNIANDLNVPETSLQSAIVSYSLTLAVVIPISGFMADRFGTRNTFILSLGLFSLGSLFCALSPTLFYLNISRVIQGIGGAMMVPVSRLVLLKTFERDHFLDAVNTSTMLGLLGPFLGPILGGYIVQVATWHWIFLINVPVGIIGMILSFKLMQNLKINSTKFDFTGILFMAVAFISITGFFEMVSYNIGLNIAVPLIFISIIAIVAYIKYAQHALSKGNEGVIFPLSLFPIRTFSVGLIGNLFCRFSSQAIPFLIPLCLQSYFGLTPLQSGFMLVPIAVGAIITKQFVTPILCFFGYKKVLIASPFALGVLVICISFLSHANLYSLPIYLFLVGVFNTLCFTSMSTITLGDLNHKQESSGNTLFSVVQQLSMTLGIAIAASLMRVFQHGAHTPFALYHAFSSTLIFLGVLTILSSFIFAALHKTDGDVLLKRKKTKK